MTATGQRGDGAAPGAPVAAPPAPARADGVQLMGELPGSGYREPPALARRVDGQVVQLTPLLYLLLTEVDGRRGYADLAAARAPAGGPPRSPPTLPHQAPTPPPQGRGGGGTPRGGRGSPRRADARSRATTSHS